MKRSDQGEEVKTLQTRLKDIGFVLEADGIFGLATEAAVRDFQTHSNIEPDGFVGPITLAKLNAAEPLATPIKPIHKLHKVKYLSQRDNLLNPSGTCNVTSIAMVADYFGVKPSLATQLEDEFSEILKTKEAMDYFSTHFSWAVGRYQPRHVHGMLEWLLEKKYGMKDTVNYINLTQLRLVLDAPVVIAGKFTSAGHIIVVKGVTSEGHLICNDPWGNWERGYRDQNGESVIYSKERVADISPGGQLLCHIISK